MHMQRLGAVVHATYNTLDLLCCIALPRLRLFDPAWQSAVHIPGPVMITQSEVREAFAIRETTCIQMLVFYDHFIIKTYVRHRSGAVSCVTINTA